MLKLQNFCKSLAGISAKLSPDWGKVLSGTQQYLLMRLILLCTQATLPFFANKSTVLCCLSQKRDFSNFSKPQSCLLLGSFSSPFFHCLLKMCEQQCSMSIFSISLPSAERAGVVTASLLLAASLLTHPEILTAFLSTCSQ